MVRRIYCTGRTKMEFWLLKTVIGVVVSVACGQAKSHGIVIDPHGVMNDFGEIGGGLLALWGRWDAAKNHKVITTFMGIKLPQKPTTEPPSLTQGPMVKIGGFKTELTPTGKEEKKP